MTDLEKQAHAHCGDVLDSFPCASCGAAVPKECPHYHAFRAAQPGEGEYIPPHASIDYYRAQVVMLADALEKVAGHVGTMQREGSADFHAGCAAIMKDCLPVFQQVGMSDDGDGFGFDRAADETIGDASHCWGFRKAMRHLKPALAKPRPDREAAGSLAKRCDEILSWRKTGIYEGTELAAFAERAGRVDDGSEPGPYRWAEDATIREALEICASANPQRRPEREAVIDAMYRVAVADVKASEADSPLPASPSNRSMFSPTPSLPSSPASKLRKAQISPAKTGGGRKRKRSPCTR